MTVTIQPGQISGTIAAIPSKSVAHRALICAALADKETVIKCPVTSEDIEATANCLKALGADIKRIDGGYIVNPIKNAPDKATIDCGESGSTLRFLLPVIAALGTDTTVKMHGRLGERPLAPLDSELERHGAVLERRADGILHISGKLSHGDYRIAADVSSQFISGLLFALPLLSGESRLTLTGDIQSLGYIKITEQVRADFGVRDTFDGATYTVCGGARYSSPGEMTVEGDWSNAAFWLTAGAISNYPITCTGLSEGSLQGDSQILNVLKSLGCRTETNGGSITVYPASGITEFIEIDAADIPDLVPIISVALAVLCKKGVITNAERLRIKESDRLQSVSTVLTELGAKVEVTSDGLIINGAKPLCGGKVDSFRDHRIAMTAAIAATVCEAQVTVTRAEAVAKSYPAFWEDFEFLGGKVCKV